MNVTIDDQNPAIVYSPPGAWVVSAPSTLDYGPEHTYAKDQPAATAVFQFTGIAIYFLSPLWPYTVNTLVSVDGGPATLINLTDPNHVSTDGGPETVQSHVVWGATNLDSTQHVLTISVGAGQTYAVVDGLIYTVLDSNSPTPSAPQASSSAPSPSPLSTPQASSSAPSLSVSSIPHAAFSPSPSSTPQASSSIPSPSSMPQAFSSASLSAPSPVLQASSSSTPRIAGATAGAVVLILLLLGGFLCYRKIRRSKPVTSTLNVPVDYQAPMQEPLSTTSLIPNRSYGPSPYDSMAIPLGSTSAYYPLQQPSLYTEAQSTTISEHYPPLSPLRPSQFSSRVSDQNSGGLVAQSWNGEEASKQETEYPEVQSTTVSQNSPPPTPLQFVQEEDAGRLSSSGGNVVRLPPNYDDAWRPSYL